MTAARVEPFESEIHSSSNGRGRTLSRRAVTLGAALFGVAVIVLWSLAPAEWSFVDDPGLKQSLQTLVHTHGIVAGVIHRIPDAAHSYIPLGRFQPLLWIYDSTFYLLNPTAAHAVRAALFAFVVLAPLLYVNSRTTGPRVPVTLVAFAVALPLANNSLYDGLSFMSLQELPALALAAGGLLVRRDVSRSAFWLGAALMKEPFSWLLIVWGILLLRRRRWWLGAATITSGAALLITAYLLARNGAYTSHVGLSVAAMTAAVKQFAHKAAASVVVGVLGLILLRVPPRALIPRDDTSRALLGAAVGYFAVLLAWGRGGGYLAAPVIWLATTAVVVCVGVASAQVQTATHVVERRGPRTAASFLRAAIAAAMIGVAAFVAIHTAAIAYGRSRTNVALRNWALSLPPAGVRIGINGAEAAVRLAEIARLHEPNWHDDVVQTSGSDPSVDYYVVDVDNGSAGAHGTVIGRWPRATVYRVKPSAA